MCGALSSVNHRGRGICRVSAVETTQKRAVCAPDLHAVPFRLCFIALVPLANLLHFHEAGLYKATRETSRRGDVEMTETRVERRRGMAPMQWEPSDFDGNPLGFGEHMTALVIEVSDTKDTVVVKAQVRV
jgi:hypothetical protein